MKLRHYIYSLMIMISATSCYEDFINDYKYSSIGFSSQEPLRTVIADRDMTIAVGGAIGGKLGVDKNDWAEFKINPELLEGTGLHILPETHYTLSDKSTMKVSKSTIPVADVTISFTDKFYEDVNSTKLYYALPFEIESSSLDSILAGKETSIVAIKYISTYHGDYFYNGRIQEFNSDGTPISDIISFKNKDDNQTKELVTILANELCLYGLGDVLYDVVNGVTDVKMNLVLNNDKTVTLSQAEGGVKLLEGNGTYEYSYDEENLDSKMIINISYKYERNGKIYSVENEILTRRQDPYRELRFEEWK